MSRTHRLVVVQVPPSIVCRNEVHSTSPNDYNSPALSGSRLDAGGVRLSITRSASTVDDVDHLFVERQGSNESEDVIRIDALATSPEKVAARLSQSLITACFGATNSSPGGLRSRDFMLFCGSTPRKDMSKLDGAGMPSAFAEHAASTSIVEALACSMLDAAKEDKSKHGANKLTIAAYTMLIYDLQPFVSFKHAAIDLLQEISGDIAPCKIPLGTQDGERVEGAAFIDGLIEAECDLRNDASKTRNILKRILDRISSGRAMLARCPAICLGIGWLPVASVIRISLEPTRRSVTIVELEGPLFVQNYIPGSLAMQNTFEALEAFIKHGLQHGGQASNNLLRLLLDNALTDASTPWWTIFGSAVISGSLLSQPWIGTFMECTPFHRDVSGDLFDEAAVQLLRFTRHFFPEIGEVKGFSKPAVSLHRSMEEESTFSVSKQFMETQILSTPPPNVSLSDNTVTQKKDDKETRGKMDEAAASIEPLTLYLETQRHLTDALRKEQDSRLSDVEGLRKDNDRLRAECTDISEKLERAVAERNKFRDEFLLEQYEAQIMRKHLAALRKEKSDVDQVLQTRRAPRPLLQDAFHFAWKNIQDLRIKVEELEKQLDVARTSETSLKEAIQSSQKVHKTVLASHEKIEQDWREEQNKLTQRLTEAEKSTASFLKTPGGVYGPVESMSPAKNASNGEKKQLFRHTVTSLSTCDKRTTFLSSNKKELPVEVRFANGFSDATSFWTKNFDERKAVPWSPDFEDALWKEVIGDNSKEDAFSSTTKKQQIAFFAGEMKVALCDRNKRVSYQSFVSYVTASIIPFQQILLEYKNKFATQKRILYITALDPNTYEPQVSRRTFCMVQAQENLADVREYLKQATQIDDILQNFNNTEFHFYLIGIGGNSIATIKVPRSQEHAINCADVLDTGVGVVPLSQGRSPQKNLFSSPMHKSKRDSKDRNDITKEEDLLSRERGCDVSKLSEIELKRYRDLISAAAYRADGEDLGGLFDLPLDDGRLNAETFHSFIQNVLRVEGIKTSHIYSIFDEIDEARSGLIEVHQVFQFLHGQPTSVSVSNNTSRKIPKHTINHDNIKKKNTRIRARQNHGALNRVNPEQKHSTDNRPKWKKY